MRRVRARGLHRFLDYGLVSGATVGNKRQRRGCGDREKTIGSHQVLQFGTAGDVCGMALLRICAIASLRLPIPQRKRDTGIQSAKSRKVVKPGWPDVRSALDLAQARRLSCWSPDPRWRMNGHVATTIRSEEHTSELQSLMRISYAVFC